jgi:sugar phosphate isomerase/epimerase
MRRIAPRLATIIACRRRGSCPGLSLPGAGSRRIAAVFPLGSEPSKDIAAAHAQVEDGNRELLPYANAAGVPLAIEPLHPMYAADRACVNTLRQSLDICDRLDPDGSRRLGLAIDVYHVWWDPEVYDQIARAGRDRIHAFHNCDWLVPTRDLLLDRGMMGDGIIDIRGSRRRRSARLRLALAK